jgi:dTDP-glucose 4,6-dehydratase
MVQRKVQAGEEVIIHGNEKSIGTRYYIHSNTFADALLYILRRGKPYVHRDGEIDRPDRYNIVGSKRLSNLKLAEIIASHLGKELKHKLVDFHAARPGHDRHYGLDGSKLAELGWVPNRSFEESIVGVLEWSKKHPEWLK